MTISKDLLDFFPYHYLKYCIISLAGHFIIINKAVKTLEDCELSASVLFLLNLTVFFISYERV